MINYRSEFWQGTQAFTAFPNTGSWHPAPIQAFTEERGQILTKNHRPQGATHCATHFTPSTPPYPVPNT